MCTVIFLRRPGHAWPLLLAANRDERLERPWDPPGAHWPDQPGVIAGRDRSGGGTWMGVRGGLVATVLNRSGSLGPALGMRSRGILPLLALRHDTALNAARAIEALDAATFRTFNMVLADQRDAVFVRGLGAGRPESLPLGPGVHMVTAHDPDDESSPRVARHLPRFRAAEAPDPESGAWESWRSLLADRSGTPAEALNVPPTSGFGTVCSSLAAISAEGLVQWLFAPGPPHEAPFEPVTLG